MLYVINYADKKYEKVRLMNTRFAYLKGKCDRVIEYSPESIDDDFLEKNKLILKNKKGGGYWLWKPYIINKTLDIINEGDYLFYCDAASIIINPISDLIEFMNKYEQSLLLFELPFKEVQFTKKEVFNRLKVDENVLFENQILAGFILLKKSKIACQFVREWLALSQDYLLISDEIILPQNELFYQSRHDQSILSVLAKKKSFIPLRDPSQFGNYDYYKFQVKSWLKNNNIIMTLPNSERNKRDVIFLHRRYAITYLGIFILYLKYRLKSLFCYIKSAFKIKM